MLLQVKALVSLESGGVPTAYLNSQQTLREKRAVFAVSLSSHPSHHSAAPFSLLLKQALLHV